MDDSVWTFKPFKKYGHKWLHVSFNHFLDGDVVIDDWFTPSHSDNILSLTCYRWLPLDKFSYSFDAEGNCCLHFPTCFGFRSVRNGRLRITGNFHSYVVLKPPFLDGLKINLN